VVIAEVLVTLFGVPKSSRYWISTPESSVFIFCAARALRRSEILAAEPPPGTVRLFCFSRQIQFFLLVHLLSSSDLVVRLLFSRPVFGSLTKSAASSCFPLRFLSARRITPMASLVYFVLFSSLLSTVLTQLDLPPRTDFARCLRSVGLESADLSHVALLAAGQDPRFRAPGSSSVTSVSVK
jgi:hypothetical protein